MTEPLTPPPASARPRSSRAALAAAAAAVLLIGALLGVALDRVALRAHRGPHGRFGPGHGWAGREPGRLDDRIARELNLTAAQRSRIDSILARRIREMEQVRQEVRPRMAQIFAQTRAEIDSVLTPPQRERMHALFPPRGRGGPPGDAGPPPPRTPGDSGPP